MKRRLAKLVVFLLLGAVVNVAVAWGLHLGSQKDASLEIARLISVVLTRVASSRWHQIETDDIVDTSFGVTQRSAVIDRAGQSKDSSRLGQVTIEVGWPMRTLYSTSYLNEGDPNWTQDEWTSALAPRARSNGQTYRPELPLRPLWPGLAINTILYAAILWLLTLGPFTARRMIRAKRGLCIKCGYDLRGAEHEACPECGVEATVSVVQ